jgi:hypothetical protein
MQQLAMPDRLTLRCAASLVVMLAGDALAAPPSRLTGQQADFFEKRIRPVLLEHCYKCHSSTSDKVKGGLYLDSRDGVLKGGSTGPAIVPGNPDRSLLIKAVRYKDKDTAMPPGDKKLPAHIIADLEQWVRMGAPDPRNAPDRVDRYEVDKARAKGHWAFQPIFKPIIPEPKDPEQWCRSPIDKHVLAKLIEKGLTPSPRADKVTLLRRASYHLAGLPPTIEEVDASVADESPEAFAKVVDRLLNSPRYGERWARHWLDVARYADTKGRAGGRDQEPRFVHSHTYRDWVIKAFNDDMPYDRFVQLQLAADRLAANGEKQHLPALGYLTLGNRFGGNQNDIIDDRIDVVAKGLMGLTVTCARCHDHKFDPIPTADYYSLHGVFASSTEPAEGVELDAPADPRLLADFQKAIADAEKELEDFRATLRDRARVEVTGRVGDYLLALHEFNSPTNSLNFNQFMQRRRLEPAMAALWRDALKKWGESHHPVFTPWIAYTKLPIEDFASQSRELAPKFRANSDASKPLNPLIARGFTSAPMSLAPLSAYYQRIFSEMERRWIDVLKAHELRKKSGSAPEEPTLADAAQEQLRRVFYDKDSPMFLFDTASVDRLVQALIMRDGQVRARLNELRRAVNTVKVSHPGAPPRAVVLNDRGDPRDSPIFIKGNAGSRGALAPRRFLEVLSGENREPFRDGSGRLELARSIASADNPLTARVIVNRVWQHQFGEGLVRTPDDFGLRSEAPTHPELLDYLAWWFMENGWSIKKLQRHIMLSAVWQQSSDDIPKHAQIDPDNKWLWQQNRRRLDFEALRDTILHIGGKLDLTMGGPGVRLDVPVATEVNPNNPDAMRDTGSRAEIRPYSERRSIYGFIDRANVGNMFVAFDFANPDLSTGQRTATIIPQQALFMMNSPLVIEQAMHMVSRDDFKNAGADADRIKLLYRLIYSRAATDTELKLGLEYLALEARMPKSPLPGQSPWEYGWGGVDARTGRTGYFWPMARHTGVFWQAGQTYPDSRYRNLNLSAQGGVPGPTIQYSAIRRWTAADEGIVSIDGALSTRGGGGDGVQGRIVSSYAGVVGTFIANGNSVPTKVPRLAIRPGDTIDFVVDCRANDRFDAFNWAPAISLLNTNGPAPKVEKTWDAQRDFGKPSDRRRLTTWQKLAQVILETNELSFVN